jgi:triosephosphate isomerase
MGMSKKYIIGNWKLNPETVKKAESLARGIVARVSSSRSVEIAIASPTPFLHSVKNMGDKKIFIGAQDVSIYDDGAHTGDVSATMLKSMGVKYCIVGHSERRNMGDTNEDVAKKVRQLLDMKIVPIICVGESDRDTDGNYRDMLAEQVRVSCSKITPKEAGSFLVAYEPVWAIGERAKRSANPDECLEATVIIRREFAHILKNTKKATETPILYGGSASEETAPEFLRVGGVQGFLLGRLSLDAKLFSSFIAKIASL